MKTETKHYATFYSPGTFVAETTEHEVPAWDTKVALKIAAGVSERYGAKPFCFIFTTLIVTSEVPGGQGGFMPESRKETGRSGRYFIGGRLRTLEQVELEEPESTLAWNMRTNRWPVVIETCTPYRHTNVFEGEDVQLNADGEIVARAAGVKGQ